MSTNINAYIDALVGREGGYTNDKDDDGGETNFGITVAVARAFGFNGPMDDMPRTTAVLIYTQRYWLQPSFDTIDHFDSALAEKLLDFGVNCGTETATKAMQRCLNVLNEQASSYADITIDGRIGSMTIAALRAFIQKRGDEGSKTLVFMVAAQQSNYYLNLAEKKPLDEKYEYGWQSQRALMGVNQ